MMQATLPPRLRIMTRLFVPADSLIKPQLLTPIYAVLVTVGEEIREVVRQLASVTLQSFRAALEYGVSVNLGTGRTPHSFLLWGTAKVCLTCDVYRSSLINTI